MTYSSRAMRVPLSQAIHYMENELLPQLERRLASQTRGTRPSRNRRRGSASSWRSTGSSACIRGPRRCSPWKKATTPKGMMGFTPDGEILVSLPLPVTFKSGTNLDRKMELVRMDVVRRIAGQKGEQGDRQGVQARFAASKAGQRGSSRTPSLKLDPGWGFWVLRQDFPFLSRLSDKKLFQELAGMVRSGSLGAAQRRVSDLYCRDQGRSRRSGRPSDEPFEAFLLRLADGTDGGGLGPGAEVAAHSAAPHGIAESFEAGRGRPAARSGRASAAAAAAAEAAAACSALSAGGEGARSGGLRSGIRVAFFFPSTTSWETYSAQ